MAKTESGDLLIDARKAYARAQEHWADNQADAEEDMNFAFLDKQWDAAIEAQRKTDQRPCLTFNKLRPIIRQVVNDARQNKPAIKVHPQDNKADVKTAEIINGLIRNIETTSDADIAYDTAVQQAVGQGFGFWRINTAYTSDDAFDQDIVIERVANPFTVYPDPNSTAADSSDWNVAFIVTTMTKEEFEREYPDAEKTSWDTDFSDAQDWISGEDVTVAEWWTREKVTTQIVALSDGSIQKVEEYQERAEGFAQAGIVPVGEPRDTETYQVTQRIMSGAEILKTVDWVGKYIPIVPVYGEEVVDETGKRHFWSLIRGTKAAQQQFNYWETTRTELVALAPKAPYIGEERAFELDPNWATANSQSHPYLMIPTGAQPPQRQPFAGVPPGAMQEALNASDNIKATTGMYDASIGAKSNETSGRAIMARQREGDVGTFGFIDNLSRSIRHGGRILLDLIPKVYSTERMVRVLGDNLTPMNVQIQPGAEAQPELNEEGKVIGGIFDLAAGKYDLTVSTGPSYTSRREEITELLTSVMQSVPDSAVFLAGRLARLLDLPDAEELGREMDMLNPAKQAAQGGQQLPPGVQQQMQEMQQVIEQGGQQMQALEQENQALKADQQGKQVELQIRAQEASQSAQGQQAELSLKAQQQQLEAEKLRIEQFRAETERMKVEAEARQAAIDSAQQAAQAQHDRENPPTQQGAVN